MSHRKEFIRLALYKVTEAETYNKHRTRYCSILAFIEPDNKLQHDHVWRRDIMTKKIIGSSPKEIEIIVKRAIGCTITKEEHKLLNAVKDLDGWARYKKLNIVIISAGN